jgi:hypothetical protein
VKDPREFSPEKFEQALAYFEKISRQMAKIFGESSEASQAVQHLDSLRNKGVTDVAVIFTEKGWVVGPKQMFTNFLGRH